MLRAQLACIVTLLSQLVLGLLLFFGFVALFPQYWLIQNPMLMLVFWTLFLGNLLITH
jgi:hypothetical protein